MYILISEHILVYQHYGNGSTRGVLKTSFIIFYLLRISLSTENGELQSSIKNIYIGLPIYYEHKWLSNSFIICSISNHPEILEPFIRLICS